MRNSLRAAAAIALILAAVAAGARPASAGIVSGCTLSSTAGGQLCIQVDTGMKDYANHRQWVTSIKIVAMTLCQDRWEAWTQGWYLSKVNDFGGRCYWSPTYYINKWVSTNNYVCGRGWKGGYATACIKISV